jgi:hypothetical protein
VSILVPESSIGPGDPPPLLLLPQPRVIAMAIDAEAIRSAGEAI